MAEGTYNQFCPIAMASEVLCTRWTLLLVRELLSGAKRFNELRRGAQIMSPALLSRASERPRTAGIRDPFESGRRTRTLRISADKGGALSLPPRLMGSALGDIDGSKLKPR